MVLRSYTLEINMFPYCVLSRMAKSVISQLPLPTNTCCTLSCLLFYLLLQFEWVCALHWLLIVPQHIDVEHDEHKEQMDEEELDGQGEQSQGLERHVGDLDEHGYGSSG